MRTKEQRQTLHRNALAQKRQVKETQGANRNEVISSNNKIYLKVRTDGQDLFIPANPSKE